MFNLHFNPVGQQQESMKPAGALAANKWNSEESPGQEWQHELTKTDHRPESKESEAEELWEFDLPVDHGQRDEARGTGEPVLVKERAEDRRQEPDQVFTGPGQENAQTFPWSPIWRLFE